MSRIVTCEQVSGGHPDKLCDQIADAIVTDVLQHDKDARLGIEVLYKDFRVIVAGEMTSTWEPDLKKLVHWTLKRVGEDKLWNGPAEAFRPKAWDLISRQSQDIALGVDRGGAGDQGIMFGYATNETPELLPIPFAVATRFLEELRDYHSDVLMADAKAQVSYDYDTGRITTFLCSVRHRPEVETKDFAPAIRELMARAATAYGLNTDYEVLINPTGRFVSGGPAADCGVTGRKLACDTYGGVAHIGGGAMSGKDPTKVDRSAAYMARKIARDIVLAGYADKVEVQLAYAIGVAEPVGIYVDCLGTEHQDSAFIERFIRENYDLTPRGIIESLDLLTIDYNKVSAYGHFGHKDVPWER